MSDRETERESLGAKRKEARCPCCGSKFFEYTGLKFAIQIWCKKCHKIVTLEF